MPVAKAKFNQEKATTAINFQPVSRNTSDHNSWFRGEHTNFLPHRRDLYSAQGVAEAVLQGHRPSKKFISKQSKVTAFGSCFASHISNHLSQRKFSISGQTAEEKSSYVIKCGEGMVNTFVLRQQFEWAWEKKEFDQPLWHGYKKEEYGYDEEIQAITKQIFDKTDVFILTVGLSEIWYDEVSDEVFWRTIPKNAFDPKRHRFRMSTVQENLDNLKAIRALIKKHRPDAQLITTLSPVPLIATFQDQACLASNSVSKATLRLAIEEFVRNGDDKTHYWPSYELVNDVFGGAMQPDMRHPKNFVVKFIMALFESVWCQSDLTEGELEDLLILALTECNYLPPIAARAVRKNKAQILRNLIGSGVLFSDEQHDRNAKNLLTRAAERIDALG